MRIRSMAGKARRKANGYAPLVSSARRSLKAETNTIALTFDDGPDPEFTPQILDILAAHNVVATFFAVGARATQHPGIVRRTATEGHALGSHTATHPDMWELSLPAAMKEFVKGRRAIESIAGRPVRLFRPPKGSLDLCQAMTIRSLGFRTWLWNVDPEDWAPDATAQTILGGLQHVGPGDVILLHDAIERPIVPSTTNREATVAALPAIIDNARSMGLEFVTLQ